MAARKNSKTPQERAQEALDVKLRAYDKAQSKVQDLEEQLVRAQWDLAQAKTDRDYAAANPALTNTATAAAQVGSQLVAVPEPSEVGPEGMVLEPDEQGAE